MYIIAIAWIYVVLLMSFTEDSIVAGLATFFLYGVGPLALLLYLMGTPQRRRNRRQREAAAAAIDEQPVDAGVPEVPGARVSEAGPEDAGPPVAVRKG